MKKVFLNREGYTVVELIVAMSVFIVMLTVSVGSFVQALRSERKLVALMAIENNAGAVIEQMAREIRTGYAFCDTVNPNYTAILQELPSHGACDKNSLSFINHKGLGMYYQFSGGVITRTDTATLEQTAMTAENVNVNSASFTLSQTNSGESICNPWRVTITMEVGSKNPTVTEITNLETTVSSRTLPVEAPGVSQDILTLNQCQLH